MFKRFRFSYLAALLIIPALLLSACNMGGKKARGDQVLNLSLSQEAPSLDSAKTTDVVSNELLNSLNSGLFREKDGELIPEMAKKQPPISTDGLEYTFELRDATWSDGKPVTAHDFSYAWLRALKKETASEYSYILYPIKHLW